MIKSFISENGVVIPAINSIQMGEIEQLAKESTGPNIYQIIENTGRNLFSLCRLVLEKEIREAKIVILAGTCCIGGGGINLARHLKNHNIDVELLITDIDLLSEPIFYQLKLFQNSGGIVREISSLKNEVADIVIDAIYGFNITDAPTGTGLSFIHWANYCAKKIISVDAPSGLDVNTGNIPGEKINADYTLTSILPKTGLLPEYTGILYLADVGISNITFEKAEIEYNSPFNGNHIIKITPHEFFKDEL